MGTALAQQDARKLATAICSVCHGPEGRSVTPMFPRLAGQQAAYLILQLEAFRSHKRADPNAQVYMWGMAADLSGATIEALANYYAAQKPLQGQVGDPALMAAGRVIYAEGVPAQNVPACATCHGSSAQGVGAFPRLGGQHVDYLVGQLEGFQSGLRVHAPLMPGLARALSAEQIKAVATYAGSR
ncbi:MAG TPA: c-type cytochrome [Burkholderiales bacterium]|nr:c-type cytochrome [Burkholderiales bacterium]